jgi:hypothetical protein
MLSLQASSSPTRGHYLACPLGGGKAWDLVGDAIGSWQGLDERFLSGDPMRNTALRYVSYD